MLGCQVFNSLILFCLDLEDERFTLALHFLSEQKHLVLELKRDFVGDALKFTAHLGGALVKVLC